MKLSLLVEYQLVYPAKGANGASNKSPGKKKGAGVSVNRKGGSWPAEAHSHWGGLDTSVTTIETSAP